ncbi:MAG: 4Fe-4S dicluster domain-containing protein [Hyphomicrobiales bacterium]|nr:4Fe-4S dicluster domain-containing protein [Hyphomicrobiales bacterium]
MKGAEVEIVFAAILRIGLVPRGALLLQENERTGELAETRTIVLAGMAGREGWNAFAASPEARDGLADPLDRWSRRVIGALAGELGARALFPFGGPPFLPFQQWARRAEPVHPSPIGILIHPHYGLWHSYRGALGFSEKLAIAERATGASPCESCTGRGCLKTCPVEAFSDAGYDVAACAGHLRAAAGADCMSLGCRARRACPVGAEHAYGPEQANFIMAAFLRGQGGG